MNSQRLKQTLMLALILIGSIGLCRAQEAKVIKRLDEHSFEVEIGGQRFKAVDNVLLNEQSRSFDKLTAERDAARKEAAALDETFADEKKKLNDKVEQLTQQRDSARRDLQDARVFSAQQKQLLDQEAALRKESQQFVPHGGGGFADKFLAFFDKPAVQAGFKIALPLAQTFRQFSMQCR